MSDKDSRCLESSETRQLHDREQPLVSVLIPVYRTQEVYLREALESVLRQTYTNFELLVLDDCPDSPREEVVRSYTDSRIRYVCNEKNLGIADSRNKLISMSKGEYLAILDHDDVCLPTRLEKQVAFLREHPEVGVVSSQLRYIPRQTESRYPESDRDIKMGLMFGCSLPHTAAMIRRCVLDMLPEGYEKDYFPAEDFRLWARLFPHTSFHNIQEPLVEYRMHGENTSEREREKMNSAHWRIVTQLRREQPEYYRASLTMAKSVTYVHLLGLPVLKIVTRRDVTKVYLFSCLLFLRFKKKYSI